MRPTLKLISALLVSLTCTLCTLSSKAQDLSSFADTTKMKPLKNGAGHELILENSTKNILGALINYGNGKTKFHQVIYAISQINDSTIRVFGSTDTTDIAIAAGSGSGGFTGNCYRDVLIDSSNFINDTAFTDATLANAFIYAIFMNDAPAFIYEGAGLGYTLRDSGAIINLANFNGIDSNYRFHVYALDTTGTCANAVTITEGGGGGGSSPTLQNAYDNSIAATDFPIIQLTPGESLTISGDETTPIAISNRNSSSGNYYKIEANASGSIKNVKITAGTNTFSVNDTSYHTSLSTGAGYVLTDIAGDGKLTMAALSGGGSTDTSNLRADINHLLLHYTIQTLTPANTVTINVNSGYKATLLLNRATTTIAFTNVLTGDDGLIRLTQDGTGSRLIVVPGNSIIPIAIGGSGTINISAGIGDVDDLYWWYDGTNYHWALAKKLQ